MFTCWTMDKLVAYAGGPTRCSYFMWAVLAVIEYGSWIYNYLCNQYLSPLKLWGRTSFMVRCTLCDKVVSDCDRSGVFFGYSNFLQKQNWLPRYNWIIVECGVKHHKPLNTHIPWCSCRLSVRQRWNRNCIPFRFQ